MRGRLKAECLGSAISPPLISQVSYCTKLTPRAFTSLAHTALRAFAFWSADRRTAPIKLYCVYKLVWFSGVDITD